MARKQILNWALTLRLSEGQRKAIEQLADKNAIGLGDVTRQLIDEALASRSVR